MRRIITLAIAVPFLISGRPSDKQAVQDVVSRMSAGVALPQEILERRQDLPDLDHAIADVRGCRATIERVISDRKIYAAYWKCKGRIQGDQPVPMLIYVEKGQVNRVVTAVVRTEVIRDVPIQ